MIFRNKLDESGNVIGNNARLVAQGCIQIGGIDFEETFAPVAQLQPIRMILSFASFKDFKFFFKWMLKVHFKWFYRRGCVC